VPRVFPVPAEFIQGNSQPASQVPCLNGCYSQTMNRSFWRHWPRHCGIIASWNRGAERPQGYRAEEAIRRHIS